MFGTAAISNMQSKRDDFNLNIKSHYFPMKPVKCDTTTPECPYNEICNFESGYCHCIEYHKRYDDTCQLCPTLYEKCDMADRCCSSNQYLCVEGYCQCNHPDCGAGVFVTASQVALSAALIMGIAALAMVVYRLCTRPKYLSARQRALARSQGAQSSENISGNDVRASLSSMQIRVINRLRDRPPAYEGSNNNVTCDRRTNTAGTSTVSASVTTNHVSTPLLIQQQNIDAPPPYINSENAPELELHRPPPYTEIILCPAGYLNESYINTEDTVSTNVNNNNNANCAMDNNCNITININDNLTSISKERNKDDVLNNKDNTKVKEDNDKNNKIDEKDNNNNNESNTR